MRYCLGESYSTGVRAAALATVLLMIPGMVAKTGYKKGFDLGSQRTLPTDEPVRWAQRLAF